MSSSPDSSLLLRTIELNYTNKKRSNSFKWIVVNSIFFLIFAYDLWCGCECGLGVLHYVEAGACGVAAANLLQHAARSLPARRAPLPVTPAQRRLLGLHATKLDSSFREVSPEPEVRPHTLGGSDESELSPLARARQWGGAEAGGSPPPSPTSPQHSPYSSPARLDPDEFIADQRALADYLRRREESESRGGEGAWAWAGTGSGAGPGTGAGPPPLYQLAALDAEGSEGAEGGGGGAVAGGGGAGSPQVWRRLQLDPRRLTQFNLNLRLWLQVTILERLVREMDALDAALAAHGLPSLGQVGVERLRLVSGGAGLVPFLAPFPDQRYVVRRYRELSAGGCLSEYRWCGGGAGWDEARPTDAELLLHAFTVYMDRQLPVEGTGGTGAAGAFSMCHVTRGSAPPRGRGVLAIHQVSRSPPHYVLACEDDTLEVGSGRNNLLHVLLLLVAWCARARPPALRRLHLGPAGLNMLWIIGR